MDSQQHLFSDPDISFLAQAKLQARVLVPVLRAIRERIGREEADKLVADALRDWSRNRSQTIMGGAKFCDFRIRLHNKAPKSDKA
jgi:hypothetical protein